MYSAQETVSFTPVSFSCFRFSLGSKMGFYGMILHISLVCIWSGSFISFSSVSLWSYFATYYYFCKR
ncbi:hypothetical protein BDW67DRAFT_149806 [Aspergillus spinulosporus]